MNTKKENRIIFGKEYK